MNKLDAAKFMVFEDPWYNKSIRDELEDGSHVDGYHTVKSKTIKPRHQVIDYILYLLNNLLIYIILLLFLLLIC